MKSNLITEEYYLSEYLVQIFKPMQFSIAIAGIVSWMLTIPAKLHCYLSLFWWILWLLIHFAAYLG